MYLRKRSDDFMREFPVTVKVLDATVLQNALHGSKICVNQEAFPAITDEYEDLIVFWKEDGYDTETAKQYILKRIKDGHESVIEHIVLVVEVSNISRALLQQFARHRLLSFSVQSTRWSLKSIIKNPIGFILPEAIEQDAEVVDWLYKGTQLVKKIQEKHGNDTAKYLLPECTPTKMLVTGNMREWRHIYKLRGNPPAMKEFNDFCNALWDAVYKLDESLAEILVAE